MTSQNKLTRQIRLTTAFIVMVLMTGLLLPSNLSHLFVESAYAGKGGPVPRTGHVLARGIERTEAGNPIWAEIGVDGKVVADINEAVDEYKEAKTFSVVSYLTIVDAFNNFKEQHKDGIAKGAYVLTRDEYQQKQFPNVDVPKVDVAQDDPDKTKSVAIEKLSLRDNTQTVLVRSQESVIDPDLLPKSGQQRSMILFEAPIDLRNSELRTEFGNAKSLLMSKEGKILYESEHNIGYKTNFFKEDSTGRKTEDALGPVANAYVDASIYSFNVAYPTQEDGRYFMGVFIPPCPGFSYMHEFDHWAKVYYRNFDPEAPNALSFYYFKTVAKDSYLCSDLGALLRNSGTLAGLMTGLAVDAIERNHPDPIVDYNFYIDLIKFSGISYLSNDGKDYLMVQLNMNILHHH